MTRGPHAPGMLIPFAEGVWIAEAPVSFLGLRLTSSMSVLRLASGGVLVHSPVALTDELGAAVQALGEVTDLYGPNLFHHLHLGDWARAFPRARVHAPADLAKKRPDLKIDRAHDPSSSAALDGIDELPIEGFRLAESVLFHRASRSLVVTDLVHNIGRPAHAWTKLYTRAMGFYDRVALSRMLRWTAVSDRPAMRQSVDRMLALPFERVIVGHGAPLEDARQTLASACAWLTQGGEAQREGGRVNSEPSSG